MVHVNSSVTSFKYLQFNFKYNILHVVLSVFLENVHQVMFGQKFKAVHRKIV